MRIYKKGIMKKTKSLINKNKSTPKNWAKGLIATGTKNPVNVSEEEIIKGCKEIRKEIYKKLVLKKTTRLNDLGRSLGKEADKKNINEEKLEEMMEETRTQVYQKRYGK